MRPDLFILQLVGSFIIGVHFGKHVPNAKVGIPLSVACSLILFGVLKMVEVYV